MTLLAIVVATFAGGLLSVLIAELSDRTLERFFRGLRNRGPGRPR